MQFTVHQITDDPGWNASAEIAAAANYPGVRTMTVGQLFTSATPLLELGAPPTLPWSVASPAVIGSGDWNATSATCWFYGKALADALGVPVGLISTNWGGTVIPSWSDEATNAACGFPPNISASAGAPLSPQQQRAGASAADAFAAPGFVAGRLRGEFPDPNSGHGVLYYAMIAPFAQGPLAVSSFIWFQGEVRGQR
jgi:hypothetical protein